MAYKFYKLLEEKVIECQTDIPSNMWVRKGLLPYEENIIFVEVETKTDNIEEIEILENKVVKKITKHKVEKTLEELKKEKLVANKMQSDAKYYEGFTCSNGIKLDCREQDKINWFFLKMQCLSNPDYQNTIRDFNNQIHDNLQTSEILIMMSELEEHYKTLLRNKWEKEVVINSCSTEEELNSIIIE